MNSKAGGKKLKAGDTVEYVICDDASGLAATQRAYHVDEVRERTDLKVGGYNNLIKKRPKYHKSELNYRNKRNILSYGWVYNGFP